MYSKSKERISMKKNRFDLQQMKINGEKAVWMTAYDYVTAQLAEPAWICCW